MPAARIITNIIDRSNYVPANAGVSAYLVLDALRGPDEPVLVTSQREFLERFTSDGEITRSLPVGYFSALAYLAKSNSLYIRRANGDGVATAAVAGGTGPGGESEVLNAELQFSDIALTWPEGDPRNLGGDRDLNISDSETEFQFYAPALPLEPSGTLQIQSTIFAFGNPGDNGYSDVQNQFGFPMSKTEIPWAPGDIVTVEYFDTGETNFWKYVSHRTPDAGGDASATVGSLKGVVGSSATFLPAEPDYTILQQVDVAVSAVDGGAWANGWTVTMVETQLVDGYEVEKAYTLTVRNAAGTVVESFLISFAESKRDNYGNSIYFEDVLENSRTVAVSIGDAYARTETTAPIVSQVGALSGGADATGPLQTATAIDALEGATGLDIRLWLNGGFTEVAFQKALVAKAELDRESFAILTTPYDVERTGNPTAIVEWAKDTLLVNSTQATAPLVGWMQIAVPGLGSTRYVSPDGYVGANLSQMMTNQNFWDIVAGFDNGIFTAPIRVLNRWSKGQLDVLVDGVTNPIATFSGEGIVLWGQRTCTPFPTALDRMNVSLLLMYITIVATRFLRPFLYRQNLQVNLDEIESGLVLLGDQLKANGAVYAYRVEVISTAADKDNYLATVNFIVEPVKGIEQIIFNEVVVNTGELG